VKLAKLASSSNPVLFCHLTHWLTLMW